jgi:hypothetical protein
MQSLGKRIVELIGKSTVITTSSTPVNEEDISNFIKDGIRDFTSKIIATQNPNLLSMLSTTKMDIGSGISIDNGFILSVVRNEGTASSVENPATAIDASLRGRVSDANSLFFHSKYNPAYYILDGVVNTLPAPTSSTDYSKVSYISSEEAVNSADYNSLELNNFPNTFTNNIVAYGAAMTCLAYASDVHNNMNSNLTLPTAPTAPVDLAVPEEVNGIDLPSVPVFSAPTLTYSLTNVNTQISNEDMDLIDKEFEVISKNMSKFEKDLEVARENYTQQLNEFNKEFDKRDKNNERAISSKISVHRENVGKYEKEIAKYSAELASYSAEMKKYISEYQWYTQKYQLLYNQYMSGIAQSRPAQQQAEA